ncbi:cytochrome P450 [Sanghuangporus baumii]|uniref:Cytochrome P450 n=1 Tax=Sanghuangporus baumii TaxID=108892 RepID=A0A9Q5HZ97_SANBA|nr:cytochrome P450 [Sanghuangporus baumii]
MSAVLIADIFFGLLGIYLVKSFLYSKKTHGPLPPGPKPKPFIGNLTDLPPSGQQEWVHWGKHKDLYGPISSLTTFGQTLILLNDQRVAFELLEKRSLSYSSRPRMVFSGEMIGWENQLAMQPYTNHFRAYRKNIHSVVGTKSAVSQFYQLQDMEVRRFLLRILNEPSKLLHHIRTEAGAIILKISHGYTIEHNTRDPLIDLADEALVQFSLSAVPGAWIVDILPFLQYFPAWMPGMAFKRTAVHWRNTLAELVEKPHAFVKKQMCLGSHSRSYTSALLGKGNVSPEEEHIIKWSAASLYAGGADTTVSSLSSFFLVMTMYPEIQRKAQEEIDRVVGSDRIPGFEDRDNLPYVDAVVKEVLRWHPIGPMGLPHTSTEDDVYEGYFIPKGSLLLANIWAFAHDAETYHDPMAFRPERFLGVNGRAPETDPRTLVFGFGRRICPGRELADASIYLTIAQSLAVFDIKKAVEDGKVVEPTVSFSAGIISHPLPFKTSLVPRSAKAEALIRSVEEDYPLTESDAKELLSLDI